MDLPIGNFGPIFINIGVVNMTTRQPLPYFILTIGDVASVVRFDFVYI